jgi:hypothetical protein
MIYGTTNRQTDRCTDRLMNMQRDKFPVVYTPVIHIPVLHTPVRHTPVIALNFRFGNQIV